MEMLRQLGEVGQERLGAGQRAEVGGGEVVEGQLGQGLEVVQPRRVVAGVLAALGANALAEVDGHGLAPERAQLSQGPLRTPQRRAFGAGDEHEHVEQVRRHGHAEGGVERRQAHEHQVRHTPAQLDALQAIPH